MSRRSKRTRTPLLKGPGIGEALTSKRRRGKKDEEETLAREYFIVMGTGPKDAAIRRVYPTQREADADVKRCQGKKGYKNLRVEHVGGQP